MKKFLFALIGLTMLSACGGGGSDSDDSDNTMAGVYMSGATSEAADANAIIYKDGEVTQLDASSISTSVFVTDSEVAYWKNNSVGKVDMDSGSYVPLDSMKSWTTPKIFIKDENIYMSCPLGVDADHATVGGYWENNDFSTPAGGLYSSIFVK